MSEFDVAAMSPVKSVIHHEFCFGKGPFTLSLFLVLFLKAHCI